MSNPMHAFRASIDNMRRKFEQPAPTHGTVTRCTPDAGGDLPSLSASGSMEIAMITRERIAGDVAQYVTGGF